MECLPSGLVRRWLLSGLDEKVGHTIDAIGLMADLQAQVITKWKESN